ncbi:hypothetical protein DFP72DRAFT_913114 [Ephemerocybe angulata]|uniref:Uncharacterized protein n=1 Tax=Ephemerocybe angulata TaxID=980116 RepID=A0A8H6HN09_9AGAR|nr:hypothetical protein DFP72DRAFT_913114 [Tulosesus angulatus]
MNSPSPATAFDGASIHAQLLNRDDYLDAADILSELAWIDDPTAGNADMLVVIPEVGTPSPADIARVTVVGVLLADRAYLDPQGHHNADYKNPFSDSKLQFSLELGHGYATSLEVADALQKKIASTNKHNFFVIPYKNKSCLRFAMPLFLKRDETYNGDVNDPVLKLPVDESHKPLLNGLVHTHRMNDMRIYDDNNALIPPALWRSKLLGAVVEVTFTLQHYAIHARSGPAKGSAISDTFTARVFQLRVLKKPAHTSPAPVGGAELGPIIPSTSPTGPRRRRQAIQQGVYVHSPISRPTSAQTTPPVSPLGLGLVHGGQLLPSPEITQPATSTLVVPTIQPQGLPTAPNVEATQPPPVPTGLPVAPSAPVSVHAGPLLPSPEIAVPTIQAQVLPTAPNVEATQSAPPPQPCVHPSGGSSAPTEQTTAPAPPPRPAGPVLASFQPSVAPVPSAPSGPPPVPTGLPVAASAQLTVTPGPSGPSPMVAVPLPANSPAPVPAPDRPVPVTTTNVQEPASKGPDTSNAPSATNAGPAAAPKIVIPPRSNMNSADVNGKRRAEEEAVDPDGTRRSKRGKQ